VDFNPEVKAYHDLNILLLRIAKSREDYVRLSTMHPKVFDSQDPLPWDEEKFKAKLREIRIAIARADLPPSLKEYYLPI
jgi:hypothetical protein